MPKKKTLDMYGNVCLMDGHRIYSSFFREDELQKNIDEAIAYKSGVIAIEKAHAGEPPVWERSAANEIT